MQRKKKVCFSIDTSIAAAIPEVQRRLTEITNAGGGCNGSIQVSKSFVIQLGLRLLMRRIGVVPPVHEDQEFFVDILGT